MAEVKRTICRMCLVNCGVKAWLENRKLIKVEGDPDNSPAAGLTEPRMQLSKMERQSTDMRPK